MRALADLAARIKAEARALGFDRVGITTPDPPPHLDAYQRWLAAGMHGEMAWLASERAQARRANPREVLPGAQSVLVLLSNYHTGPHPEPEGDEPRGRVAQYALNDDYHDVLTGRLKRLVATIEGLVGRPVANRWYTDTGPILERELAQRAGLGWIGKNTMLINPQIGSYTLIAELFLDLALPPDAPFTADFCGSCTRCIAACPTGAIEPGRRVDARACISYHTIELKGAIPPAWRAQMGAWVFGCDICQQVCPWNRFASATADDAFAPRDDLPNPRLLDLLTLNQAGFSARFKGSPVKRSKRRGLLRNAMVAAGNSGDARAVPALSAALHDDEPLVRAHAAWALGQLGTPAAPAALEEALAAETDDDVRRELQAALEKSNTGA